MDENEKLLLQAHKAARLAGWPHELLARYKHKKVVFGQPKRHIDSNQWSHTVKRKYLLHSTRILGRSQICENDPVLGNVIWQSVAAVTGQSSYSRLEYIQWLQQKSLDTLACLIQESGSFLKLSVKIHLNLQIYKTKTMLQCLWRVSQISQIGVNRIHLIITDGLNFSSSTLVKSIV